MSQSKIRPPLFREGQIARIVSAEELEYQIEPNHLEYGLAVAMDRTGGSAYRMLTDDPRRKLEAGEFALIATTEIVRFNYFSGATERERRDPGIEIEPIYESARNGDEVRCRIGIEFRIAAHNNENVARSLHGIMTRRGSEVVSAQDFLNERGREFGDYVHLVIQSFQHKNAANDLVSPNGFRELNKDAKDILAPRLDEVGLKYMRLVPHIYPRLGKKERIKESPDAPNVDTPMEPQPNRETSNISKSAAPEKEQPKDDSSQKPIIDPTPGKPMEPQPSSETSKSTAPEKEQPKDDSSQKPRIDPTPGKPALSPTPTRPDPAYQRENTTQRKPLATPSTSTPIKESIAATPTQAFLQKNNTASKSSVTPSISTKERPIGAKRPGAVWDANQDPSLRQPKSKRIRIGWLALWLGTGAIAIIAIIVAFLYIFTDTSFYTDTSTNPPTTPSVSSDSTDTNATKALKIGYLADYSVSPDGSNEGSSTERGVQLAIEQINAAGGVNGQPVEYVIGDTEGESGMATVEARRLIDVEGVSAIVGPLHNATALAVGEGVAASARIPVISPWARGRDLTDANDKDYLFRTAISHEVAGIVLANNVVEMDGINNVGVIYPDTNYGFEVAEGFSDNFDGTVTRVSHFIGLSDSYLDKVRKVAENGASALVIIDVHPDITQIIIQEAIENRIFDTFYFSGFFSKLSPEVANYIEGAHGTSAFDFPAPADSSGAWSAAYEAKYGAPASLIVSEAYDAVVAIALAAEAADSVEGWAIRDQLRSVNSPSPGGLRIIASPESIEQGLLAVNQGRAVDYVGAASSVDWNSAGDIASGGVTILEYRDGIPTPIRIEPFFIN